MVVKNPAFLFPGQGAQYQGMALDILEAGGARVRELFALVSEVMGRDMRSLIGEADGETLRRSDIAQPVITLANLAAAAYLGEQGILPGACAGFSLGEYAALVTAGVVDAETCFRLVKARGKVMQDAADRFRDGPAGEAEPDKQPGMAAVIGLDPDTVEALILRWKAEGPLELYGANFNSRSQVVVSGTAAALGEAERRFKEAGARRVVRLQVAGPFHSPLIAGAAEVFGPVLAAAEFKDPSLPLFSNVSGGPVASGSEAKRLALRQITEPVRWTTEEQALAALGIDAVLETGPGKVLQGLWKDAETGIPCFPSGTAADIETLAGWQLEEKQGA
ncbi:MAG: ACP S-malonyltransferase [Spirochaetaceae bacterium]|jgi:[acyl-carrier-protein] S-malonyltransferase|nr:ACP S-malonyltransferase [Spirochaetaceae bacterium]